MNYLFAALSGLAFGLVLSLLKYLLLWRPYLKAKTDRIYLIMMLSSLINVAALFSIFLIRDILPFSYWLTLIALAFALNFGGKFLAKQAADKSTNTTAQINQIQGEDHGT